MEAANQGSSSSTEFEETLRQLLTQYLADNVDGGVQYGAEDPTWNGTWLEPIQDPTLNETWLEPIQDPALNGTYLELFQDPSLNGAYLEPTQDPTLDPTYLEPSQGPILNRAHLEPIHFSEEAFRAQVTQAESEAETSRGQYLQEIGIGAARFIQTSIGPDGVIMDSLSWQDMPRVEQTISILDRYVKTDPTGSQNLKSKYRSKDGSNLLAFPTAADIRTIVRIKAGILDSGVLDREMSSQALASYTFKFKETKTAPDNRKYVCVDGTLYMRSADQPKWGLAIPREHAHHALCIAHRVSDHGGRDATYKALSALGFHCRGLSKQVVGAFTSACTGCKEHKKARRHSNERQNRRGRKAVGGVSQVAPY